MFTQINQTQILDFLNKEDIKIWIETQCKTLPDYQQFCADFANIVCSDGRGFRKSFESQFYVHKDSRYEYHFFLNCDHGYLEINSYPVYGGRSLSARCPIAFKSRLGQQIPMIPANYSRA
jgi:hypothetical protein